MTRTRPTAAQKRIINTIVVDGFADPDLIDLIATLHHRLLGLAAMAPTEIQGETYHQAMNQMGRIMFGGYSPAEPPMR